MLQLAGSLTFWIGFKPVIWHEQPTENKSARVSSHIWNSISSSSPSTPVKDFSKGELIPSTNKSPQWDGGISLATDIDNEEDLDECSEEHKQHTPSLTSCDQTGVGKPIFRREDVHNEPPISQELPQQPKLSRGKEILTFILNIKGSRIGPFEMFERESPEDVVHQLCQMANLDLEEFKKDMQTISAYFEQMNQLLQSTNNVQKGRIVINQQLK
jgi:hypothetical protein